MLYSWVAVDLELSLFHDTPPKLDTTSIFLPLPAGFFIGQNSQSMADSWKNDPKSMSPNEHRYRSLAELFQTFMTGQLSLLQDIPTAYLLLLLHPLQAFSMRLHSCLDTLSSLQTSEARANTTISLASMTFIDEYMALLARWRELAKAVIARSEQMRDRMLASSLALYYVMVLNGLTSFSEVERLTRLWSGIGFTSTQPSQSWLRNTSLDGLVRVMTKCGQCINALRTMPLTERPIWWAAAVYRVALILSQSIISINATSASTAFHSAVSGELTPPDTPYLLFLDQDIGTGAEDDDRRFRHFFGNVRVKPVLMDGDGGLVMLDSEVCVLDLCLNMLNQHVLLDRSDFACGILDQLTELRSRWSQHI